MVKVFREKWTFVWDLWDLKNDRGKSIPGRGDSMCRGPVVGSMAHWRNRKVCGLQHLWPEPFNQHLLYQHQDMAVESLLSVSDTCNTCVLGTQNWRPRVGHGKLRSLDYVIAPPRHLSPVTREEPGEKQLEKSQFSRGRRPLWGDDTPRRQPHHAAQRRILTFGHQQLSARPSVNPSAFCGLVHLRCPLIHQVNAA